MTEKAREYDQVLQAKQELFEAAWNEAYFGEELVLEREEMKKLLTLTLRHSVSFLMR